MVDWMGTVLAQLLATTWFQALLALATLGSVVLAVVFYLRSKKEKQPRYAVSSYTLVEGLKAALDGLEVSYKGQPQERITVTKVCFWNAGLDTIRDNDLTPVAPLQITVEQGAQVLQVITICTSAPACQFSGHSPTIGEADSTAICLSFNYLDKDDGGVIQIVHTGPSDHPVYVTGKIVGAQQVSREQPIRRARIREFPLTLVCFLTIIAWAAYYFRVAWQGVLIVMSMIVWSVVYDAVKDIFKASHRVPPPLWESLRTAGRVRYAKGWEYGPLPEPD